MRLLIFSSPRIRAAGGCWSHKHPRTTITYADSRPAVTTLAVREVFAGYRRGGHTTCKTLAPGTSVRRTPARARLVFRDRVGRHTLAPGNYVLAVTPVLGSLRGATETARFQVR